MPQRQVHRSTPTPSIALVCIALVALLSGGCDPPPPADQPPAEETVKLMSGSLEPQETRGAPYPPAEPSDRTPNPDDEEEWPPVPDGPVIGDMQPANSPVQVREIDLERDDPSQQ